MAIIYGYVGRDFLYMFDTKKGIIYISEDTYYNNNIYIYISYLTCGIPHMIIPNMCFQYVPKKNDILLYTSVCDDNIVLYAREHIYPITKNMCLPNRGTPYCNIIKNIYDMFVI